MSESEAHCQCGSARGSKVRATGISDSKCWCLFWFFFFFLYRFNLWKFIVPYLSTDAVGENAGLLSNVNSINKITGIAFTNAFLQEHKNTLSKSVLLIFRVFWNNNNKLTQTRTKPNVWCLCSKQAMTSDMELPEHSVWRHPLVRGRKVMRCNALQ